MPSLDPAACRRAYLGGAKAEWDYVLTLELCRNRELAREKVWSRIHLVPLLMAEGDRDLYRREQAALAREREIMKDVQGWEVCDRFRMAEFDLDLQAGKKVYHDPRYRTPEIVIL